MSSFKRKKQDRYALSKSDIDFYKMTGVFAIVCVFVLLALNMQSSQTEHISSGKDLTYNFYSFCHTPLFVVMAVALAAGALAWFIYSKVKKVDESGKIFTSTNCLCIAAYLALFCACFGLVQGSRLHGFFIAVTIGAAVLYYVSKLYNADFVIFSAVTAVFAMAVNLFAMMFDLHILVIKVVIIALGVVSCVYFHKKIDSLKVSKQKKASFLKFPVYIPLALGALFLFWAGIPGLQNMLFLNRSMMMMVLLVQYIVFAIVYTIRRIKD